jgi:hypothetical protein
MTHQTHALKRRVQMPAKAKFQYDQVSDNALSSIAAFIN